MIRFVLYIWQLPQGLLGTILLKLYNAKKVKELSKPKSWVFSSESILSGISLGPIIILKKARIDEPFIQEHEHGHSKQSLFLGPLYLLVIGLPSVFMNILSIFSMNTGTGKFAKNYYNRWPESWADKLGGVNRGVQIQYK